MSIAGRLCTRIILIKNIISKIAIRKHSARHDFVEPNLVLPWQPNRDMSRD